MATTHAGRISINQGTFTLDTCTVNYDLVANQANKPAIRNMLEFANRRALTTLLVSGAITPYGVTNPARTKIPQIKADQKIGANTYRFDVMGRIEKAVEIIRQVGATQADGSFQLLIRDKYLVQGMNAFFYTGRFAARVMSFPTGSQSQGYLYNFQSTGGDLFNFATHVAPQPGTKTCFGAYTSYSEKSLRGYGRSKFPDTFINHMTIQRKTVAISGGAASNVLWYSYENNGGEMSKGWMYQELQQAQAQFTIEDERQKWFGVSTMKNADGTVRAIARLNDNETNLEIVAGDGWEEQVAGGNVAFGSGLNGEWTEDDLSDMMKQLEKKADQVSGITWVGVTGTDGYANGQKKLVNLAGNQNVQFFQTVVQDEKAGGADVNVGYNFGKFNINGNTLILIKHPMFDDELFAPEKGADGQSILSSTLFLMNVGSGANMNMEVLCKGANGIDRSMVTAKLNGLTGSDEMVISEEDAMKYAMLKENLLAIYNTQECGIIYKS